MKKRTDQEIRNCLTKKAAFAAMFAALLLGCSVAANSEEFFVEEFEEDAFASSQMGDNQWEESDNFTTDSFFETDDVAEDGDIIMDDLFEDEFLEDVSVIPEDEETAGGEQDFVLVYDGIPEEGNTEPEEMISQDDFAAVSDTSLPGSESMASGECGVQEETVFWNLDEKGILHIYGEGCMMDWKTPEEVPWYAYGEQIKELDVSEGVIEIGSYAFSTCALETVRIG